jgi:hypothetical protein
MNPGKLHETKRTGEGDKKEQRGRTQVPARRANPQSDYHKFAEIIRLEIGLKHCKANYK